MRCPRWTTPSRPSFSGPSRRGVSARWAGWRRSRWTCASSPPPTLTCRPYIEEGKFRRDLYYRLSTFQIHIPPLRERRNDIPALTQVILQELSQKLKRPITITQEALGCLTAHDWPGNVRELRNVLEFSAYLSDNGAIVRQSLPEHIARPAAARQEISLAQRVREFERGEIRKLLLQNGSDLAGKKRTAQQLGISLATLYNKLGE